MRNMKGPVVFALASVVAVVCLQAAPPRAQGVVPAVEGGYTSLFNGKDFTGWKFSGPAESFSIQDSAAVAGDFSSATTGVVTRGTCRSSSSRSM